ncbi:MAG TPA: HAD family hydrolase [Sedimentibacter sp.]|jgi:Cof subfamily protein (haloacid dehalogenase superfamily)|nr:HAD family phosphatase [Sedimentibacter sp.]HHY99751.1 HAD family phosphatase [Tissierellia bacterium]HOK49538.1 HAD family hydrolase [Sedimentibacter sp.]HOW23441.1 HAD family hydrolase [Sedimentibacter sp.]HRC80332.1 HAD family hydrolase [Sedimentibacter sp.]
MKYKMVVLDLDGTLLSDDKTISDKNAHILKILHKQGIHIVIATGRNYYMAKSLLGRIEAIEPVILANNGAVVRRYINDEFIESNYLDYSIFETIYEIGMKHGLNPIIHVDEYQQGYDLLYECENYEEVYLGYIKKDYKRTRCQKFKAQQINNILSVCYFNEYQKLTEFKREIEKIPGEFNIILNQNLSSLSLLEFLNINSCKWRALKKYTDRLGIGDSEVIAMGDDNNDIELISNSGLGIAMKNATESIKRSADLISRYTNNESGVYYELSEIFGIK